MKLETLKKRLKGYKGVTNLEGRPSQFVVEFENGRIFQSYNSIIVVELGMSTYLTSKWNYSVTTGKYRNKFLGEDRRETEAKINAGFYKILE